MICECSHARSEHLTADPSLCMAGGCECMGFRDEAFLQAYLRQIDLPNLLNVLPRLHATAEASIYVSPVFGARRVEVEEVAEYFDPARAYLREFRSMTVVEVSPHTHDVTKFVETVERRVTRQLMCSREPEVSADDVGGYIETLEISETLEITTEEARSMRRSVLVVMDDLDSK